MHISGDDGTLLSIAKELEQVLPKTPLPPKRPLCHGLKGEVSLREPEQDVPKPTDQASAVIAAEKSSIYSFKLVPDTDFSDSASAAQTRDQTEL